MSELRKVAVYEWQKVKGESHYTKICIGNGLFHQFGSDHEEFEEGPGNFSTAIVEMPDGTVMNVPADMIVFNN